MAAIPLLCPIPGLSAHAANRVHFPFQTKNKITYPSFSWNKKKNAVRQPWLTISSGSRDDEIQPKGFTASAAVLQFYDCINEKNLKKLGEFISEDCCFEDYSYVKAFKGKREVAQFFEQLTECMGNNVRFIIQSICQGDDSSVAVTWHLEWKGMPIPFTRGCSFCEYSKQGNRLVIKHARAMIESPIKPGPFALTLLKVVTYLFDEFPAVTEKFLQKPHVILEFLQRIYMIFLEPFVHPIMEFYMNFSKLVLGVVGYMLNILIRISRFFLK